MTERDKIVEIVARALADCIGLSCDHPQCDCDFECERFEKSVESRKYDATAALAALEQAGYAIVPREPTEAMLKAGGDWLARISDGSEREIYKAMLAASSPKE
jgi:hypothetical protein